MNDVCALVLAAGDGKRMKSKYPKVLCRVLEQPMIQWVLRSVRDAGIEKICVITGKNGELVREAAEGCSFAEQKERLGTGHAAAQAMEFLRETQGDVLVLCGDAPFIDQAAILGAYDLHTRTEAAVTVVTARLDSPTGYGRIVREGDAIAAIVEEADADEATRAITEVNSGAYWFNSAFLQKALVELSPQNSQGEYYLTDTVKIAVQQGKRVSGYLSQNPDVILGANDRQGSSLLRTCRSERIPGSWQDVCCWETRLSARIASSAPCPALRTAPSGMAVSSTLPRFISPRWARV